MDNIILIKTKLSYLVIVIFSILLSACGVDSGADNIQKQDNNAQDGPLGSYKGPGPSDTDTQNFKLELWDNIVIEGRCVDCHNSQTKNQSPLFADFDNVNTAYDAVKTIVNVNDPSLSKIITKVSEGHNCWLSSDSACVDIFTRYIDKWLGGSNSTAKTITLLPIENPTPPGATKSFPTTSSAFSGIHSLLKTNCQSCHIEGKQTPFIASNDIDTAYDAAKNRINLEVPSSSRLIGRLRTDFHNCWDNDCTSSANTMQDMIEAFVEEISSEDSTVEGGSSNSSALVLLTDGIVANSGGRFEDDIIVLYEFKEGKGIIANDTSAVEPLLPLTLSGNTKWVGGWGINIGPAKIDPDTKASLRNGKAQASTQESKKLYDQLKVTGEYSIEAWVIPNNIAQEDARIITYSGSSTSRNFTLGQSLYNYEVLHRSSTTDQNTTFATADADERLQASLQHVVVTFSPGQGRKIYVNGAFTGDVDSEPAGTFNEWDNSFALVLGNETDGNSLWQGIIRMVAIHKRALSDSQIDQNFKSGVGEKFFLPFSVSHLIDEENPTLGDDFIVFQASQMDDYSYLFIEPYFISLNKNTDFDTSQLKGMRLGVNGKIANVAQSYQSLDLSLNSNLYSTETGQPISRLGTLVNLEKGPSADEFYLNFEQIGNVSNPVEIPAQPTVATPVDSEAVSDIGLKTFDEINTSMSIMTGVSHIDANVKNTFDKIKQQLPTVENIGGFLSAHQMAMTQLAIQYCNTLVEDNSLRASFFPSFDFTENANTAFDVEGRNLIINPLLSKFIGSNLSSQPLDLDVTTELNSLMDTLTACANTSSCDDQRTKTTVKASCAAVLGSATTLVQ